MTSATDHVSQPEFHRASHAVLALVAVLLFWLLHEIGLPALHARAWYPSQGGMGVALDTLLRLLTVAIPTALALGPFDTRSAVTLWPRRWRDLGSGVVVAAFCVVVYYVVLTSSMTPELRRSWAHAGYGGFFGRAGFETGWFVLHMVAGIVTEELLYRVLIQRGLAGYVPEGWALIGQALVFQLAHTFVYGYDFTPTHGVVGLILGFAFMRTRSLAAPVALHLVINTAHVCLTAGWAAASALP